ncbi:hypothetical protein K0U83_00505 [bacterium]|nr:hypothetical protein [bacterium]
MADGVIFSDIMSHLVSRLTTGLTTLGFTSTRVGILADDSNSQVIIRRDGGTRRSKTIMTDSIGVNVYETSYANVESLARNVMALFDDMPDGNPIVDVTVESSMQDVTDLTAQRRFMRFAVDHRGTNLS